MQYVSNDENVWPVTVDGRSGLVVPNMVKRWMYTGAFYTAGAVIAMEGAFTLLFNPANGPTSDYLLALSKQVEVPLYTADALFTLSLDEQARAPMNTAEPYSLGTITQAATSRRELLELLTKARTHHKYIKPNWQAALEAFQNEPTFG